MDLVLFANNFPALIWFHFQCKSNYIGRWFHFQYASQLYYKMVLFPIHTPTILQDDFISSTHSNYITRWFHFQYTLQLYYQVLSFPMRTTFHLNLKLVLDAFNI